MTSRRAAAFAGATRWQTEPWSEEPVDADLRDGSTITVSRLAVTDPSDGTTVLKKLAAYFP